MGFRFWSRVGVCEDALGWCRGSRLLLFSLPLERKPHTRVRATAKINNCNICSSLKSCFQLLAGKLTIKILKQLRLKSVWQRDRLGENTFLSLKGSPASSFKISNPSKIKHQHHSQQPGPIPPTNLECPILPCTGCQNTTEAKTRICHSNPYIPWRRSQQTVIVYRILGILQNAGGLCLQILQILGIRTWCLQLRTRIQGHEGKTSGEHHTLKNFKNFKDMATPKKQQPKHKAKKLKDLKIQCALAAGITAITTFVKRMDSTSIKQQETNNTWHHTVRLFSPHVQR